MKTLLSTMLALVAFAGNSVLCRLALGGESIDAASFTSIRLLSGIIVLLIILKTVQGSRATTAKGSWQAAFFLFIYAITFSYAYVSLETGIGALILFSSVQITMIVIGLCSGNKLHHVEWLGMLLAFSGFLYLILPSLTTPSLVGFILMAIAGIAWGFYTLAGKGAANPLSDTAYNFLRTLPLVIILVMVSIQYSSLSWQGIWLAIFSGGITSGLGYAIWYMALRGLSGTQAAVVQLLVPAIAAIGGVLFASEIISIRLIVSSVIILSGILVVILGKHYWHKVVVNKANN